uniref:Uncharacterized protein n=1 Tax=Odontella aurita TaxID=265563 RepID=A0A7S4MXV9_9STRA
MTTSSKRQQVFMVPNPIGPFGLAINALPSSSSLPPSAVHQFESSSSSAVPNLSPPRTTQSQRTQELAQKQQQQHPGVVPGVQTPQPVVETPSGQPAQGLPGYAAVRDDDELDIYALFFSQGNQTSSEMNTHQQQHPPSPTPQQFQLPPPQQQQQAQPQPPPQPIAPSLPLSAPLMQMIQMPSTMPSMVTPELPSPLVRPQLPPQAPPRPNAQAQPRPLPPSPQLSGVDIAKMSRRNFVSREEAERSGMTSSSSSVRGGAGSSAGPIKKRSNPFSDAGEKRTAKVQRTVRTMVSSSSSSSGQSQSPHSFLLSLLRARGRHSSVHKSAECGYKSSATPLQLASYGTAVLRAAQSNSASDLSSLLRSGLSRNPCNRFSESILDMSAKRGSSEAFAAQLDAGADVRTADDFGRTPLHHAAWGSSSGSSRCFDIVMRILDIDPEMARVADDRGKAPFEYVRSSEWGRWIEFLKANQDRFWPARSAPELLVRESIPRPERGAGAVIADPQDALQVEVAKLVADGRAKPEDARSVCPDSPILTTQGAMALAPGAFKFPSMITAAQAGGRVSGGSLFSSGLNASNNNGGSVSP